MRPSNATQSRSCQSWLIFGLARSIEECVSGGNASIAAFAFAMEGIFSFSISPGGIAGREEGFLTSVCTIFLTISSLGCCTGAVGNASDGRGFTIATDTGLAGACFSMRSYSWDTVSIHPETKGLVVNEPEAKIVQELFATYIRLQSLSQTAKWAHQKGYHTKSWTTKDRKSRRAGTSS